MKKGSYLTIQDWMVTDLHLKGNELLAYALIYGFSQDEQSCFYGSYQYVMEWLGVDKTTAVRVLRNLENKGLLRKWQEKEGNVTVNRYATNTTPACPAASDPLPNATGWKMHRQALAKKDKKKLWSPLVAKKICKSIKRLVDEAGVKDRAGYAIAMLNQSIENGWTGVFAVKDFVDKAPAVVHRAPAAPDKPRKITKDTTLADLLGGVGA